MNIFVLLDRQSAAQGEVIPGPSDAVAHLNTVEEYWSYLFSDEIIQIIVDCTNDKIESVCSILVAEDKAESYHHLTDVVEIRAYLGVLYYAGLWHSSKVSDNRLWDTKNGINFYRCVFSRHRFTFLSSTIRFDKKSTRNPEDRFSPVRNIWGIFIENCKRAYNPSKKLTVDEQLLSFRGRCIFRMYMKAKPDKYGLKLVTLNDAETAYLVIDFFAYFYSYFSKILFFSDSRNTLFR